MSIKKIIVLLLVLLGLGAGALYWYKAHKAAVSPKTILAFLGAPGSGKGTLAKKAVGTLGFVSVSTGDLCRAEVASGSEKGKKIAEYMKGGLVPDEVITDMLDGWLKDHAGKAPIIIDGYPRTKEQAEKLATLLQQKFSDYVFGVVYLFVSDEEEVVQRIADRLVCEKCKGVFSRKQLKDATVCPTCGGKLIRRDDDREEIVRARLKTFAKNNDEILAYYKSAGIPIEIINVSHSTPEDIFATFTALLNVYTKAQSIAA